MRILVIDRDQKFYDFLSYESRSHAFISEHASNCEDGIAMAGLYDYDIIVLDMMGPGGEGVQILKTIRENRIATPILVASFVDSVSSKISSFDAGADDYVPKSLGIEEFMARMVAITRRAKGFCESVIRVDSKIIHMTEKTFYCHGKLIHLTPKEYEIVELLGLRKGKIITKEVFLNHLYQGEEEPSEKTIDVFICKIRKKILQVCGHASEHIQNVWGQGYVMKASDPCYIDCKIGSLCHEMPTVCH